MKLLEKQKAVQLRKTGLAYSEILEKVDVSKATLSIWLRDVELNKKHKKKLLLGREKSRAAAVLAKHNDRIYRTKKLILLGKHEMSSLMKHPLFFVGLALYWAEGSKGPSEKVKFTNSDVSMVQLMMRWFKEICKVPNEKFRVHLHIHNLHIRKDVELFWSTKTGIPKNQFYKTYVKQSSLGFRRNMLYNGTCAIVVNDKSLFRRMVGWKLGMQDFFGFSPRSSMDRTSDF